MRKVITSTGYYVQSPGEVRNLPVYARHFGAEQVVMLLDPFVNDKWGQQIQDLFKNETYPCKAVVFGGECCDEEVGRVAASAESSGRTVVIGIGGGKTMDTARKAARVLEAYVFIVPSSISTDAPCTRSVALYNTDGTPNRFENMVRNPDMVIVDIDFVVNSPVRFLASGMGDALATFYEGEACTRTDSPTLADWAYPELYDPSGMKAPRNESSLIGRAAGGICREVLMTAGIGAYEAVKCHRNTPDVERVTEACVFLSGFGAENSGISLAHSICNGLSLMPEIHSFMHGERVAFGLICQLTLEVGNGIRNQAELDDVRGFFRSVGLPVTLNDLNLGSASTDDLRRIAEFTISDNSNAKHFDCEVTPEILMNAFEANR